MDKHHDPRIDSLFKMDMSRRRSSVSVPPARDEAVWSSLQASIAQASETHPRPTNLASPFTYGTAGFRMDASKLDSVVFRVGLLAALRSKKLEGRMIGVMITASHNPAKVSQDYSSHALLCADEVSVLTGQWRESGRPSRGNA